MEVSMKFKLFSAVSLLVFLFVACVPSRADADESSGSNSPVTADSGLALQELGFHVFAEPVQLPPFTLKGLEGGSISSGDFAGTITLLNFWATWCPPCRKEMPTIERLQESMKDYNFRIVAVSVGEKKQTVQSFIDKEGYTFPVYLDERGAVGAALANQGIPTTYILDTSGKVIAGIVGAYEFDNERMIQVIRELSK